MTTPNWDERYASGQLLPWDTGRPNSNLVALIERGAVQPGRALDVGCGTGTNALWLAECGFEVVGVDISPHAIARARAKAEASKASVRFEVQDFLTASHAAASVDFVFDCGVLHVFDDADSRARFAAQVGRVLAPGGRWLSIAGSTEGPPRDQGPPRRSARELIAAVEPALEIVELRSTTYDVDWKPMAWELLSRVREVPAQPGGF